jgi:hypothetical protein
MIEMVAGVQAMDDARLIKARETARHLPDLRDSFEHDGVFCVNSGRIGMALSLVPFAAIAVGAALELP